MKPVLKPVFIKVHLDLINEWKGFFSDLKEFVGTFKITDHDEYYQSLKIMFWMDHDQPTDHPIQVDLECGTDISGKFKFEKITHF